MHLVADLPENEPVGESAERLLEDAWEIIHAFAPDAEAMERLWRELKRRTARNAGADFPEVDETPVHFDRALAWKSRWQAWLREQA